MHLTLRSYVTGFALSLALTLIPYWLVTHQLASQSALVVGVVAAALLQLCVQLGFFLHVDLKPSSRQSLLSFAFTLIIVLIIVGGSLWIMHDLNYWMMEPIMNGAHGTASPAMP